MIGKLINGKIVYHAPIYNFLSGGNWKDGWSNIQQSTGGEMRYDYNNNNIEMIEGCRYKFELEDNVAKIIKKVK
jgi:hypothetical protein